MALKASELKVGQSHTERVVENLSRTQIVMYAGVSGDYNPLHTDEVYTVQAAGYKSVFAHGMLTMGLTGKALTNFKTITGRVKYLEDLEKKQAEGDLDKFTKKEKILKEREIAGLRLKFDGIRKLTRVPDVIFVTSLKEGQLPVHEAKITNVKVVGIVNTDSNPKQIDYPITANDNSKRSVELILEAIKKGAALVL